MDTRPANYLRHRLERLSKAIEATGEHFSELSAFGRYPASAPYYERSGILQLLDSLEEKNGEWGDLMQEFERLEQDLRLLEADRGTAYRQRLREELSACLDAYFSAVCHANLGGKIQGSDQDLLCRDRIVILIRELEKDHDLSEAGDLLRMLDTNLFPRDATTNGDLIDTCQKEGCGLLHTPSRDRIEG